MSEIKMLPLPSVLLNWPHPTNHVAIRDYARANVAHATAAMDAEIHRLRAEVDTAKGQAEFYRTERNKHQRKSERLAEALLELCNVIDGHEVPVAVEGKAAHARAALRDHDQEVSNG